MEQQRIDDLLLEWQAAAANMTPQQIATFNYNQSIARVKRLYQEQLGQGVLLWGMSLLLRHRSEDIQIVLDMVGYGWIFHALVVSCLLLLIVFIITSILLLVEIKTKNTRKMISINAIRDEYRLHLKEALKAEREGNDVDDR